MNIGIAVTTHNRPDLLADTLAGLTEHTPNAYILVVDDASKDSETVASICTAHGVDLIRHDTPQGIPAAKNACLAGLMDAGCTDLFLFDDDTRPVAGRWWEPYVNSAEGHASYCWLRFKNGTPVEKMAVIYEDDKITGYTWSMGCMIYVHRDVVNVVGGFHYGFGIGMEEHADFSQRIHNAGFTTYVHQDVAGTAGLFWAGDEHCAVKRSLPSMDRQAQYRKNEAIRLSRIDFAGFEPYRPARDVVLSCYFAGVDDVQRPGRVAPSSESAVSAMRSSVKGYETVVLTNCLFGPGYETVRSTCSPYIQRWVVELQWLREHPEVRWVWLVDATDVVMLNEPQNLEPGILYAGYEPKTVGIEWMRKNSPAVADWVEQNSDRTLLNCGVVGGDRETVMRLCQRMVDMHAKHQAAPLHEMAYFNIAAYSMPMVTGPRVTSLFKYGEKNSWSYWAHK